MSEDLVLCERPEPGLALVTLNRQARRNALSIAMLEALIATLEGLAQPGGARVAILRGAGPVFCAGLDLAEATQADLVERSAQGVAKALATLRHGSVVTIAAVHGGAYAGGAGMVAACDMAVASSEARFAFPEARRGLLPALICDPLKTKIREGDLRELLLVGNTIDAQRALQIGLVQRVVSESTVLSEALLNEATLMARGVLAGGPQTIIETKALIDHAYGFGQADHSADPASIEDHLRARRSPEATEGLKAFLEKRDPAWMNGI
jgi:methylglutaconyl-CoA hydratase